MNCLDFNQRVTHPAHNRGHPLDFVITHSLYAKISLVVDVEISHQFGVFLSVSIFLRDGIIQNKLCYLTTEVVSNCIVLFDLLKFYPPLVDSNSKLTKFLL